MPNYNLSDNEIVFLAKNYDHLLYDQELNKISGTISFDVKYKHVSEPAIQDSYEISIDLNSIKGLGLPKIFETKGRILAIAANKGIPHHDLHLNNTDGEMCLIIEPKIKERYPDGFVLEKYLKHVEEHLYWISYYEKYDKKPWKEQGHGSIGYVELYLEDKEKYGEAVKAKFGNKPRNEFRKLMRDLRKKYKI
jgi:hypothetical protein